MQAFTTTIEGHEVRFVPRGKSYQAVWYDGSQRVRKGTRTGDVERAINVIREVLKGTFVAPQMTLDQALNKIWNERWQHQAFKARWTYMKDAIAVVGNLPLCEIKRDHFVTLRDHWESLGASGATVNRKIATLMVILRTARDEWELNIQIPKLQPRQEKEGRKVALGNQEVTTLLEHARPPYDHVFRFLIETGIRVGEMCELEWCHFDLEGRTVSVPGYISKNSKTRVIPLTVGMSQILDQIERLTDRPWPSVTKARLRAEWTRCRILMGREDDPDFVPHCLRHTCATRLITNGVPTIQVKEWLGHAQIETTERYVHSTASNLTKWASVIGVTSVPVSVPESVPNGVERVSYQKSSC